MKKLNDKVRIKKVDKKKKSTIAKDIFDVIQGCAKIVAVLFIIRTFVFNITTVSGQSMRPTLNDGDRLIVWQLFYTPELFDVIVLKAHNGDYHVKRILGTPGDRVDYMDGKLFINGELIDEPYIYHEPSTRGFTLEQLCQFDGCDVIPEAYFLVLGDHRNGSGDSRNYGLIHRSQILGRAVWRTTPLSKFGTFE